MKHSARTRFWQSLLILSSLSLYRSAAAEEALSDLTTLTLTWGGIAQGVSADGSVVVGLAPAASTPFVWTAGSGFLMFNHMTAIRAVSADGMTFVGDGNTAVKLSLGQGESGKVFLGSLGGTASSAYAVSANGDVVVGESEYTLASPYSHDRQAFRWTASGGMVSLGTLNGGRESRAFGVSADGSVVVGATTDGSQATLHAFRWTEAGGMVKLGMINDGATSQAFGVSGDGSVVTGYVAEGLQGGAVRAFRWTAGEGMVSLGKLNGGNYSSGKGISADGKVIVGNANDGSVGNAARGFRWSAASGMQSVEQWLRANGVNVGSSLATKTALATNADGSIVVGQLQSGQAYIARLLPPSTGGTVPPDSGGTVPPDSGGTVPPDSGGTVPPSSGGTLPPGSGGTVPPSAGGTLPPSSGGTAPPGSGVIEVQSFEHSLRSAGRPHSFGNVKTGLILHGLNGSPMRSLLKAGQQSVWVGGDLGRQDHADHEGTVGAGEAGYAYGLSDRLMLKLSVGKTYSQQRLLHDGATTLRGSYVLPELIYALPGIPLYATISAYYNVGTADTRRGYLNAEMQDASQAEAPATTSALRLRLDWVDAFRLAGISFSPYASVSQARSKVGEITEKGGGFPVRWEARSETDTQTRLGSDASYNLGHGMHLVGRFEAVRRLEAAGSDVSGEILGLGGFRIAGEASKRDWLRAGFGVEGKAGPGSFSIMANLTTEAQTPSAWIYGQYRIRF